MTARMARYLLMLFLVLSVSGCYMKPVRHLAADVALLKVGQSTRQEVVVFLGDPDEQQDAGDGTEKWLYRDKDVSLLQKTPLIGSKLGAPEYNQVVITFKNGVVVSSVYSHSDDDELGWTRNYSWQEKKK